MKLATFTWTASVEVPDNFDLDDSYDIDFNQARKDAYGKLHICDGELTSLDPV